MDWEHTIPDEPPPLPTPAAQAVLTVGRAIIERLDCIVEILERRST